MHHRKVTDIDFAIAMAAQSCVIGTRIATIVAVADSGDQRLKLFTVGHSGDMLALRCFAALSPGLADAISHIAFAPITLDPSEMRGRESTPMATIITVANLTEAVRVDAFSVERLRAVPKENGSVTSPADAFTVNRLTSPDTGIVLRTRSAPDFSRPTCAEGGVDRAAVVGFADGSWTIVALLGDQSFSLSTHHESHSSAIASVPLFTLGQRVLVNAKSVSLLDASTTIADKPVRASSPSRLSPTQLGGQTTHYSGASSPTAGSGSPFSASGSPLNHTRSSHSADRASSLGRSARYTVDVTPGGKHRHGFGASSSQDRRAGSGLLGRLVTPQDNPGISSEARKRPADVSSIFLTESMGIHVDSPGRHAASNLRQPALRRTEAHAKSSSTASQRRTAQKTTVLRTLSEPTIGRPAPMGAGEAMRAEPRRDPPPAPTPSWLPSLHSSPRGSALDRSDTSKLRTAVSASGTVASSTNVRSFSAGPRREPVAQLPPPAGQRAIRSAGGARSDANALPALSALQRRALSGSSSEPTLPPRSAPRYR
jgi:hypothetical protein